MVDVRGQMAETLTKKVFRRKGEETTEGWGKTAGWKLQVLYCNVLTQTLRLSETVCFF